jgi:hypothetical protein
MSVGWKGPNGGRYLKEQQPLAYRVGNRFRRHVKGKGNPRGRIIRPERCTYCPRKAGQRFKNGGIVQIQAAHIDYTKTFLVLWLCQGCHRQFELQTLRWRKRDLHDYSSLLNTRPHRWLDGVPF